MRRSEKGLADEVPAQQEERFVVQPHDMGVRPGIDLAKVHDLEGDLEVDAFLNVTRKLQEQQSSANATRKRSKQ